MKSKEKKKNVKPVEVPIPVQTYSKKGTNNLVRQPFKR